MHQLSFPSLKKNYLLNAVSSLMGIVYPIVTLAYVARVIGPTSIGKYYFANSLVTYFLFAACLGIPTHGAREIGRTRGDPGRLRIVFSELFAINAISSIVFWLLYLAVVAAVPNFRSEALIFGILGFLLLGNTFTFDFLYTGLERQGGFVIRNLISKLFSLILIFLTIHKPDDYVRLAVLSVFTVMLYNILGAGGLKYWVGFRRWNELHFRKHFPSLMKLLLSLLFLNVYLCLDSVVLGLFTSPREVGLYNVAMRPCRLAAVLITSAASITLPRLAYYFTSNQHGASRELQKKSFELLCFLAFPLCGAAMISAPVLIPLLYGRTFHDAVATLIYASPLIFLNSIAGFIAYQFVLPGKKETVLLAASMLSAFTSLLASFVLIPLLHRNGAVVASLLAECVSIVAQLAFLGKLHPRIFLFSGHFWKYLVASGFLILVLFMILNQTVVSVPRLGVSWISGALVYGALLWLMREPVSRMLVAKLVRFRP